VENAGPGSRGTGYGVRGTGSRGVENAGCGKRGVWWKTRGVENAGSGGKRGVPFFSPKYEFSSLK